MSEEKKTVEPDAKVTDVTPDDKKQNNNVPLTEDKDLNEGLKKLSTEELIDIIRETRGEAKTRRLKQRELEDVIKKNSDEKKLSEQAQLEQNQEFEKLYGSLKEDTKDYGELKEFKKNYLETCKEKVENLNKGLTTAEQELFELSSKNMSFNEQLIFVEKLIANRVVKSDIDKTQDMGRSDGSDVKLPGQNSVPFGNNGGVVSSVMSALKNAKIINK